VSAGVHDVYFFSCLSLAFRLLRSSAEKERVVVILLVVDSKFTVFFKWFMLSLRRRPILKHVTQSCYTIIICCIFICCTLTWSLERYI